MPKKGFYLGYRWNPETGRVARKPLHADLRGHCALMAPTGAGKGVCHEIPNFLLGGLNHCTTVSIDPSGQNAAVCAEALRNAGLKVLPVNPSGLHVERYPDLATIGLNPLMQLDPAKPDRFFKDSALLADATIPKGANESQPHFPLSARGLWTWLEMHCRNRDGDKAHLGTCRDMLMEAEHLDAKGKPVSGLRFYAAEAVASCHPRIANMAGYYLERSREIDSIKSTCATATRFLEGEAIRADLTKNGVDLAALSDTPTVLFLMLGADDLEFDGPWLRIVITCILNALYRRGNENGVPVLLALSEFAQLGELEPIRAALGQARKYGVRLFPTVLQDVNQLRQTYGPHGAGTFIANSRYLIAMRPDDDETAEFLSRHAGEHAVPHVSVSNDPQTGQPRINLGTRDERLWPAHKIRELPDRHALVWKSGKAAPMTIYCPPYWDIPECRAAARPDPFHLELPPLTPRRRPWWRPPVALLAALLWAGALLMPASWLHVSAVEPPPRIMTAARPAPPPHAAPPVLHHHTRMPARRRHAAPRG